MIEPTGTAADAATILFNLPDYHVICTTTTADRRQVIIEIDQPSGCPSYGVMAVWWKERRLQRLRDTPVAGPWTQLTTRRLGHRPYRIKYTEHG